MAEGYENLYSMPVGALGIIGMRGCEELCASVDGYIRTWRQDNTTGPQAMSNGYLRDSYLIGNECPRFGTGEAKALITETVRGYDLFIISDCFNHGVTYKMFGKEVPMSPDDHFQDLKRIIGAVAGKARRINVIMTMLYEGRQHRRSSRESLDCAVALQELVKMGVTNLITFDAHDPRVQNAIPLEGFENVIPNYQFIKALIRTIPDLQIDRDHMMIISPDEGAMSRCIYYSSVLNLDLGGDLAHAAIAGALRPELTLEVFKAPGKPPHQGAQFAEFGHIRGAAAEGGSGRRHLAAADFCNGAAQFIRPMLGRPHIVAVGKAVDGALDGAQGFAAPHGRLGADHLIAQVAHAAREAGQSRLAALFLRVMAFNLIEQGDQFTPQSLPFTSLRLDGRFGHIRELIGAGHG